MEAALRVLCAPAIDAAGSPQAIRAIKRQVARSSAIGPETVERDTADFAQLWGEGANREAVRESVAGRV